MSKIAFTVLGDPTPQGSMRGIVTKSGKVVLKSDNPKMRPWRWQVGWEALRARGDAGCHELFARRHVPVRLSMVFFIAPPQSKPKDRTLPAVKPDLDKLCRAVFDACKGILWLDDGQIVEMGDVRKVYGLPARAEITVEIL